MTTITICLFSVILLFFIWFCYKIGGYAKCGDQGDTDHIDNEWHDDILGH